MRNRRCLHVFEENDMNFEAFVKDIEVNRWNVFGVEVYENGELATGVQMSNREGGYGYFVWKYLDGFSINGKLKQKCYVLPKRGLVITQLCEIEDTGNDLRDSMEKWILGI